MTIFDQTLSDHGLALTRRETTSLQVNLGLTCDLTCRHCHLSAGPERTESMTEETAEAVIACAQRFRFSSIDVTGGAPELNPNLTKLVQSLAPLTDRLIVRTNLISLARPDAAFLPDLYRRCKVALVASLPAINQSQTDAQRGSGVWDQSISVLKRLNQLGYGCEWSGLELDLASNPSGAFLPAGQRQTEQRFRQELKRRHGISFTSLLTFTNVPLGRYRQWLEASGNIDDYLLQLRARFNPTTLAGVMCRYQISVRWDGYLYDCDFNLAADLPIGQKPLHISELHELPSQGSTIRSSDHCFACTAGSGFSCGGSIT